MLFQNSNRLIKCLLLPVACCLLPVTVSAKLETALPYAFMVDLLTETIMLEKKADVAMAPASMSKLMTTYEIFSRLKSGELTLEDEFRISKKAWKMGGSKMFVKVGKKVSVEDLLRGIIVQSGNDACIVVAENIAGTEDAFAEIMNNSAQKLGLKQSSFANATGMPHDQHKMSARDLYQLSRHLIEEYPAYYPYFAEKEFTYSNITQANRNPILAMEEIGADGLKTGHTEASGYGLVASAQQDGRRIILAFNGADSKAQRAAEGERLLRSAFRDYAPKKIADKDKIFGDAKLWFGTERTVPITLADDLMLTVAKHKELTATDINFRVDLQRAPEAPVKAGQEMGMLYITVKGAGVHQRPLIAVREVPRTGFIGEIWQKLIRWISE